MSRMLPLLALTAFALVIGRPGDASAHGSMIVPESRVYHCFVTNPENPMEPACRAAKDLAGTQQFYDWNGVNQANAAGNHMSVVPDGKLCSGNNPTFRGMDLPRTDWRATPIAPGPDGMFEFTFRATAPHATRDWIFYVTRQGYDPTQPLRWSDLFEFCRFGNVPLVNGDQYKFRCSLPNITGKHVIYTVWQRSDSTEAFYTCTDVSFTGGQNPTWVDEGPLTAQNALATGTTVSLRLFNQGGSDVERIDHVVAAGQGAAADWPFNFANTVNGQSSLARIGVLGSSGNVTPVRQATGNRVFTIASQNLNHQIDIRLPSTNAPPTAAITANTTTVVGAGNVALSGANSRDPDNQPLTYSWQVVAGAGATLSAASGVQTTLQLTSPAATQTVSVRLTVSDGQATNSATINIAHQRPGGGGTFDFVYPTGIGSYVPGTTVVQGSDGLLYRCRPFPEGQWCNINSPFHYAPGTGANWQDAWTRLP